MKTSSKIILTVVTTLGIASGVFAFGAHKMSNMSMHDKADMMTQRVTSKLDLNQEQQTKLTHMTDKMISLVKQAKSESSNHEKMMQGFINDQPFDQAALLEKIQTKTSLVEQHAPEMVALLANFVDSLNAEQKAELKEMMEHKMSHKGHGNKMNHRFN